MKMARIKKCSECGKMGVSRYRNLCPNCYMKLRINKDRILGNFRKKLKNAKELFAKVEQGEQK